MSMNEIVRSSSSTRAAGNSPATILQKMQSGSPIARGSLLGSALALAPRGACVRDRLGGRRDLARVARRRDLLEQLSEQRAFDDAELARELVAAHQRRARLRRAPAQSVREHP